MKKSVLSSTEARARAAGNDLVFRDRERESFDVHVVELLILKR